MTDDEIIVQEDGGHGPWQKGLCSVKAVQSLSQRCSILYVTGFRVLTERVSTEGNKEQSTEVFCLAEGYITLFSSCLAHPEGSNLNSALPSHKTSAISLTALHNFLLGKRSNKVILNCRVLEITVCAGRGI